MTGQDLLGLIRRQPFRPFRIRFSDGETRDINRPFQVFVTQTYLFLPLPSEQEIPERAERLNITDIVRTEDLPASAPSAS